jgi:hypothetical protein
MHIKNQICSVMNCIHAWFLSIICNRKSAQTEEENSTPDLTLSSDREKNHVRREKWSTEHDIYEYRKEEIMEESYKEKNYWFDRLL